MSFANGTQQAFERDTFKLFTKSNGLTSTFTIAAVSDVFAISNKPIQENFLSFAAVAQVSVTAIDAILWGSIDGVNFNVKLAEIKESDAGWKANSSNGETVDSITTMCKFAQVQLVSITGTSIQFGLLVR